MANPFTDGQRSEWTAVYREALALAEYMDRPGVEYSAAIRAAAEPRQPYRSRLAGLREARNDLLEMADRLSGAELRDLDQHLRHRVGIALDTLQGKRLAKIAALRAKGSIATDTQFRLVYGRHEQIWQDPALDEEAAELRTLMAAYDEKVSRRLKRGSSQEGRAL